MRSRPVRTGILLVLLGLAAVLRWHYIHQISLFIDEFVTAWAAHNVLIRGVPLFPSGTLYPHGLLFTYLVAPLLWAGLDEILIRLPAFALGLAMVPTIYAIGRRLFSAAVGLMAAAAVAVDPACIIWAGRARMYSLLQILVLLVIYLSYRGIVEEQPRHRYLAAGLLVLAILTHAEALLLLPVLIMTALVVWPWRQLVRRSYVLPLAISVAGAFGFFGVWLWGQTEHIETIQAGRPYLALGADVVSNLKAFAPFFLHSYRLPFSILALTGLFALWHPAASRKVLRLYADQSWGRSSLSYLYTVLILFLVPFFLLVGESWQNERYLFLLLPLLFLVSAAVLHASLAWLSHQWKSAFLGQEILPILGVTLFVGLVGSRAAFGQEPGYDQAFRYLQERQPSLSSTPILTFSPPAAALYLERCDYFAAQRGYQEYVVHRAGDGALVDLWTAAPVLENTEALIELLKTQPGVWFIVDEWRFQTRYEPDFVAAVLGSMELVYHEREVMIFYGRGYRPFTAPSVKQEPRISFGSELLLAGFDLARPEPEKSGPDALEVTLHWQALRVPSGQVLAPEGTDYVVRLDLVGSDGKHAASCQEPVLHGLYRPYYWPSDQTMADRHALVLPASLSPGNYRLELTVYRADRPDAPLPAGGQPDVVLDTLSLGQVGP